MRAKTKGRLQGICIGLVFAILLAAGTTVLAISNQTTLSVIISDIKLVVDGKPVTPKDATGKVVEPFIVDGTTYLPVRAIADALGKKVDWDESTNTIYIGKKPGESDGVESTLLTDLAQFTHDNTMWAEKWQKLSQVRMNNGEFAEDCFYAKYEDPGASRIGGNSTVSYMLNGEYTRMYGNVFLDYDSMSASRAQRIKIWGDDKLLYTSPDFKAGVLPKEFDVNLMDVVILKISAEFDGRTDESRTIGVSETILVRK